MPEFTVSYILVLAASVYHLQLLSLLFLVSVPLCVRVLLPLFLSTTIRRLVDLESYKDLKNPTSPHD